MGGPHARWRPGHHRVGSHPAPGTARVTGKAHRGSGNRLRESDDPATAIHRTPLTDDLSGGWLVVLAPEFFFFSLLGKPEPSIYIICTNERFIHCGFAAATKKKQSCVP